MARLNNSHSFRVVFLCILIIIFMVTQRLNPGDYLNWYSCKLSDIEIGQGSNTLKSTNFLSTNPTFQLASDRSKTYLFRGYLEKEPKGCYATFVVCNLCGIDEPIAVSIIDDGVIRDVSRNLVPIIAKDATSLSYKYEIVSCVSPMHDNFDRNMQLVEWVELNKILGIDFFVFYVTSVSYDVMKTLRIYVKQGIAEIIEWDILNHYEREQIHYMGQQTALNDCLLKMKGIAEYLITIDLDEFILPQNPNDNYLSDILFRLPKHTVYKFRNVFFPFISNDTSGLTSQSILDRENKIYPDNERTKVIVRVADTEILGVHDVWRISRGKTAVVSPEIGLLHHYRVSSVTVTNKENLVKHDITLKYGDSLNRNVQATLEKLEQDERKKINKSTKREFKK